MDENSWLNIELDPERNDVRFYGLIRKSDMTKTHLSKITRGCIVIADQPDATIGEQLRALAGIFDDIDRDRL